MKVKKVYVNDMLSSLESATRIVARLESEELDFQSLNTAVSQLTQTAIELSRIVGTQEASRLLEK